MKNEKGNMKKKILFWYMSFLPLVVSAIGLAIYFFADTSLFYYAFTIIWFIIFFLTYFVANKLVTCKEGYTLIQAMSFYKACYKMSENNTVSEEIMMSIAKKFDFASNYSLDKLHVLYSLGKEACDLF